MNDRLKKCSISIGIIIAVYLSFKYLLPMIIPFLLAYLIVLGIHPFIDNIHKKIKVNKGIITSVLILVIVGLFLFLLKIVAGKVLYELRLFMSGESLYEEKLTEFLSQLCHTIERFTGIKATDSHTYLMGAMDRLWIAFKEQLPPLILNESFHYVKGFFQCIAVVVIIFVSIVLLEKDYDQLKDSIEGSYYFQRILGVLARIGQSAGMYLRAQGLLMIIIASICTGGLFLLKNPYALLLGIIIGILDALPILGTGTVFIPWAIITFVQGDFTHAAAYATLWLVTCMTREYLEPKFIGEKLGVYPIVIMMTIYIGLYLYGISGIILGPLSLLVIIEVFKEYKITKNTE